MSNDIALVLNGWDYRSDEITVRRILGVDGKPKIQMRLDLGVLQMETDGRPDGKKPHGWDSLLEYHLDRLSQFRTENGMAENEFALGFELDSEACAEVKQESMQYYHRYLSLFHLQDYRNVIRDTDRHLRVSDLMRDYAVDESDRMALEQFRPYVILMNTRARACLSLEDRDFDRALSQIDSGIERIEDCLREYDREESIENCREIVFLEEWSERIRNHRPPTKEEELRQELRSAVETEDYEKAAKIRDQINALVG